jgi:NUDIX domain
MLRELIKTQQPLVINVGSTGCWLAQVDSNKKGQRIASMPVHPLHIAASSGTKWRFSAGFNNFYRQLNPVVLITGETDDLLQVEQRAVLGRRGSTKNDCAAACIPLTYAQVSQLMSLCAAKQHAEAWDVLDSQGAFIDSTATLQRRGRKLQVDTRFGLLDSKWFQPCMLVCILYYPDMIKVAVAGGKRCPLLTTVENYTQGGESTVEAAVREVQEETGLTLQPEQLVSVSTKCGMHFFTVAAKMLI